MASLLLTGIRDLDLSSGITGPYCAKMLADYGADVIKLERPQSEISSISVDPIEEKALFLHLNREKKSITLNLENHAGRELFLKLVDQSDIIIENYPPGAMDTLGLGYEFLHKRRPNLVLLSVTPFGQSGPYKNYNFTELTIFAMGGAMHREGLPGKEPLRYGGDIGMYFAGTVASAILMASVYKSLLSNNGEWIDLSIFEALAGHPHQIGLRAPYIYSGATDDRTMPRSPTGRQDEPYAVGTFRCKDGFVSFLPLGTRMWPGLARMIGKPELITDERFMTGADRRMHFDFLEGILQEWFNDHTRTEVFKAGQAEGLPCAPIQTHAEAFLDPQFLARNYFVSIEHPEEGLLSYTGLPFQVSDIEVSPPKPSPTHGQHNKEIYMDDLNMTHEQFAQLCEDGVI